MLWTLLALALLLVAAGCGSDAENGTPEVSEDAPKQPSGAETRLEITVWPEGEAQGAPQSYTLTCGPAGGNHPDPETACGVLEQVGAAAFAPVPEDAMCTQQYGGPQEALVRGAIAGELVDARLAYTDGCEIARWDAVSAVVPLPGGGIR